MRARLSIPRLLTAAMLLTLAPLSRAATPVTVVGADLEPRRVNLQGLDDESLSYFDADRQYRTQPAQNVLQLRDLGAPDPATPESAQRGFIETADGQRVYGAIDLGGSSADKIAWNSPALGLLEVPLDDLRTLATRPLPQRPAKDAAQRDDFIVLANGDTLAGTLVGADAKGIQVKPGQGDAVTLPWDRVRGFVLFNAAPRRQKPAHRVWLADGSRVLATRLSLASDQLSFTPLLRAAARPEGKPAQATMPLSRVTRIDLFATTDPEKVSRKLVELADLPMGTLAGGEAFGVPLAPYADDQGIHLHAPVKVAFTLPAGASRFTAVAELDLAPEAPRPPTPRPAPVAKQPAARPMPMPLPAGPALMPVNPIALPAPVPDAKPADEKKPEEKPQPEKPAALASPQSAGLTLGLRGDREADAAWADFDVIASINQKEVGRVHLSGTTRRVRLNFALPPGSAQPATLEVEVVPGANGPIMDRLRLTDASVLIVPP